jgi:hypothetical protein
MPAEATERNGGITATDNGKGGTKTQRRQRRMKSIGATSSASEMTDISYVGKVEPSAIDWNALDNFEAFSTSADGSFPKVKSSKSSYIDLKTKTQECDIASGRVYRVHL